MPLSRRVDRQPTYQRQSVLVDTDHDDGGRRPTNEANTDGEQNRALHLLLAQASGLTIKFVSAERRQLLGIKVCLRTRRLRPYFDTFGVGSSINNTSIYERRCRFVPLDKFYLSSESRRELP